MAQFLALVFLLVFLISNPYRRRTHRLPVKILQNTFSDQKIRCIAQLRPGVSFPLSALRFLDRLQAFSMTIPIVAMGWAASGGWQQEAGAMAQSDEDYDARTIVILHLALLLAPLAIALFTLGSTCLVWYHAPRAAAARDLHPDLPDTYAKHGQEARARKKSLRPEEKAKKRRKKMRRQRKMRRLRRKDDDGHGSHSGDSSSALSWSDWSSWSSSAGSNSDDGDGDHDRDGGQRSRQELEEQLEEQRHELAEHQRRIGMTAYESTKNMKTDQERRVADERRQIADMVTLGVRKPMDGGGRATATEDDLNYSASRQNAAVVEGEEHGGVPAWKRHDVPDERDGDGGKKHRHHKRKRKGKKHRHKRRHKNKSHDRGGDEEQHEYPRVKTKRDVKAAVKESQLADAAGDRAEAVSTRAAGPAASRVARTRSGTVITAVTSTPASRRASRKSKGSKVKRVRSGTVVKVPPSSASAAAPGRSRSGSRVRRTRSAAGGAAGSGTANSANATSRIQRGRGRSVVQPPRSGINAAAARRRSRQQLISSLQRQHQQTRAQQLQQIKEMEMHD